jgi:hypothetical protein
LAAGTSWHLRREWVLVGTRRASSERSSPRSQRTRGAGQSASLVVGRLEQHPCLPFPRRCRGYRAESPWPSCWPPGSGAALANSITRVRPSRCHPVAGRRSLGREVCAIPGMAGGMTHAITVDGSDAVTDITRPHHQDEMLARLSTLLVPQAKAKQVRRHPHVPPPNLWRLGMTPPGQASDKFKCTGSEHSSIQLQVATTPSTCWLPAASCQAI